MFDVVTLDQSQWHRNGRENNGHLITRSATGIECHATRDDRLRGAAMNGWIIKIFTVPIVSRRTSQLSAV